MRVKNVLMSVSVALFLCLPTLVAQALQQTHILERGVGPLRLKGETIDKILEIISEDYKIPIGIDLADSRESQDREIDVNLPEMALKSVLDYLVMQDSRYGWKLEGKVIHFFPVKDRDNLLATLLDTKLSRVSFSSELRLSDMKYEILSLPELERKLDKTHVKPLMFEMGIPSEKLGVPVQHSDLTLRELLDQITLTTSRRFWMLSRWGDNNKYLILRL